MDYSVPVPPTLVLAKDEQHDVYLYKAGGPEPTDGTIVGCYICAPSLRSTHIVIATKHLLPPVSPSFASVFPHLVFAGTLRFNYRCWCGAAGVDYARLGGSVRCNRACTGDST